ncbi:MAG: alpha-galactosidase [Lachnospiraceae bacterium]|nr:alpha-galactosidase [Lachnospiraceae bacterium]
MKRIDIHENGLHMVFAIVEGKLRLLHFSKKEFQENTLAWTDGRDMYFPVEIQITGRNRPSNWHGVKSVQTSPGCELLFREQRDYRNQTGRKLEWVTEDPESGLVVTLHYQFFDGLSVIRCWTSVYNGGEEEQGVESVSSFCLTGIFKEAMYGDAAEEWRQGETIPARDVRVWVPRQSWRKEMHWNTYSLEELGLTCISDLGRPEAESSQVFRISNTGNWSSKEYVPLGYVEDLSCNTSLFWQIEHNGSWHYEISDFEGQYYLALHGPDEYHNHCWKNLKPGETYTTVPVCVGAEAADFDAAMGVMTQYRRRIRRPNQDNETLPVIFNDYMNCLFGDPTTEKELEMIPKAKEAGCEYYVIDAGWYGDGFWWDSVGEWLPSEKRFPGGFKKVMDAIREAGMIPGAWLELEVMGIRCPLADKLPDDWFFMRHGKRIKDKGRYQLDYRNPEVRAYADSVVKRLVEEYGVGYIKLDYNIEPGIGTTHNADSAGEGLLSHNRAYLQWLDSIFQRYPDLVIENCSSGGMRADYALLSRQSIHSTSDQEDYRWYATVAANAPAVLTPEQAAVWTYPLSDGDEEETIFNMVSAMLLRIHQSGHLANLDETRFQLIQDGIRVYKEIRQDIKKALPFWPLGLSTYSNPWAVSGLMIPEESSPQSEKCRYLAVWRRDSEEAVCRIPVKGMKGKAAEVVCIYPKDERCNYHWEQETGELVVELPRKMTARLFVLR